MGFFDKIKAGLAKTRDALAGTLGAGAAYVPLKRIGTIGGNAWKE